MFRSKLHVGESIFTTMSRLANEHEAVNLGQGFPDYQMDNTLIELVNQAMKEGLNQYPPARGVSSLREEIARKIEFLYQTKTDPATEICITPGATYAIYTALTTVLNKGDEVIVFEPMYDSYVPNIELNGAVPVLVPVLQPDFKIDWTRVKDAITSKTRMIIVNQPHNPSGMLLSEEDMKQLTQIVIEHNLYLLSDEVYEHLVFDGLAFESVLKYPELFKRSFVAFSFGKVYHCTGWKTGYCVAPKELMDEFMKVHQFNAFSSFGPVQYALATYLKNKDAYLKLSSFFEPKRELLKKLLKAAGLKPLPSHGSFFQLYSYADLSDMDELSFAKKLTAEAGVTAIPVSAFYADKRDQQLLRFCFAKKDETLHEAGKRLIRYFGA